MSHDEVTVVILAGGRATRLPGKLLLPIEGEPMIARVHRQLARAGKTCIVSVRDTLPPEVALAIDSPIVTDKVLDAGPLGGLAAAASEVTTPLLFAAAADCPNLDEQALDAVMQRYELEKQNGEVPDAVIPRHANGEVEPLAALYDAKALQKNAQDAIERGEHKVMGALAGLRVAWYDIPVPEETRYVNVNTGRDLENLTMRKSRSDALFEAAQQLFPGGVNSPVRAFRGVGGTPRFLVRGEGSRVYDVDGRSYIDYVGSWGPLILGHAHPDVVAAIARTARSGTSFGAPNPLEIELGELIQAAMPSLEMLRFVNSGTEAAMSALRLARACTKRELILKFDGCYHGHTDAMLAGAGSGGLTFGIPSSAGVPEGVAAQTIVLPYNHIESLERAFKENGSRIACTIVEPIAANMGLVNPEPQFLRSLAELSKRHNSLLIFDEVITGFRVALGGAQALYGITPDLTCLGKIIGGGLPVGAFGGRKEIMRRLAPLGDVYQAGTLSGNPLAMAAGIAQLRALFEPGAYARLDASGEALEHGLRSALDEANVEAKLYRIGSIFSVFFTTEDVKNLAAVKRSNSKTYASFFHAMLDRGIYLAPSAFEVGFLSLAHSPSDIHDTVEAARSVFGARGPWIVS